MNVIEFNLKINSVMKRLMYAAAMCAAMMMCVMAACEPTEVELTTEETLDAYLPYEMGSRVKFRSDNGLETEMSVVIYEREYSDDGAGVQFEKMLAMLSADSTEMLSVMMNASNDDVEAVSYMAMFEHWTGSREASDLYAGEFYFADVQEEGADFREFVKGLDAQLVSTEAYGSYDDYETGENDMEETGRCVLERGKGFVEFTMYGDVWRLVE